jgi:hypothetical protein
MLLVNPKGDSRSSVIVKYLFAIILSLLLLGQLDESLATQGILRGVGSSSPRTVQLLVANDSAEELEGDFILYYDDADEIRSPLQRWNHRKIAPGATEAFEPFTFPTDIIVKQLFLVFEGRMGLEEEAVTGSVVELPDFLIAPR